MSRLACVVLGCVALGCAPPAPPSAPAPIAKTAPSPSVETWAAKSWEEKHDAMTWRVLPHLGRAFQKFKHEPAPSLGCTSCHGEDAEAVAYKMPHGLPPLDPKAMPDPKQDLWAGFMTDVVLPDMAEILERPLYDPATKQGFSCFGCHPEKR